MFYSIPARILMGFYAGFLLFYFVPWNLKNADQASALEDTLRENYGTINSLDELGIALTQLSSVACAIFSLISVYKCGVVIFASQRQTVNIWLYPLAVILSIGVSLLAHERYYHNMLHSMDSIYLFAQPLLALFRGFIFYKIVYAQAKLKIKSDEEKTVSVTAKGTTSVVSMLRNLFSKSGFVLYWVMYIFVGSFFYNEMVKYILEEHISMSTVMKLVLV